MRGNTHGQEAFVQIIQAITAAITIIAIASHAIPDSETRDGGDCNSILAAWYCIESSFY